MTPNPRSYALTLTEAAEALADRQLTSVDLAATQLARVRATDAAVCAWETLDPEHVLREAARWDATPTAAALGGIGIGVKDIIATADLPTTMGSPIFASHRPTSDATCVDRLRAAGAFVFGKTVTTPFAFMDPGKTRNPWDPAHTPGGSSSGSAAAVAVDELHLLWRREMVVGAYRPRWVRVRSGEREIYALTFAVRHAHPQYAGRLSLEEEARVIAGAKGAFGSSLDYLERTRVALVTHGIIDPYLEGIAARVAVLRG